MSSVQISIFCKCIPRLLYNSFGLSYILNMVDRCWKVQKCTSWTCAELVSRPHSKVSNHLSATDTMNSNGKNLSICYPLTCASSLCLIVAMSSFQRSICCLLWICLWCLINMLRFHPLNTLYNILWKALVVGISKHPCLVAIKWYL